VKRQPRSDERIAYIRILRKRHQFRYGRVETVLIAMFGVWGSKLCAVGRQFVAAAESVHHALGSTLYAETMSEVHKTTKNSTAEASGNGGRSVCSGGGAVFAALQEHGASQPGLHPLSSNLMVLSLLHT